MFGLSLCPAFLWVRGVQPLCPGLSQLGGQTLVRWGGSHIHEWSSSSDCVLGREQKRPSQNTRSLCPWAGGPGFPISGRDALRSCLALRFSLKTCFPERNTRWPGSDLQPQCRRCVLTGAPAPCALWSAPRPPRQWVSQAETPSVGHPQVSDPHPFVHCRAPTWCSPRGERRSPLWSFLRADSSFLRAGGDTARPLGRGSGCCSDQLLSLRPAPGCWGCGGAAQTHRVT